MYEYVYGIVLPTDLLKIGRWSGSISALRSRYAVVHIDFEMFVFQTQKGKAADTESTLHKLCSAYRVKGEMFQCEGLAKFLENASLLCQEQCQSTDHDKRVNRLRLKRLKVLEKENLLLIARVQELTAKGQEFTSKEQEFTAKEQEVTAKEQELTERIKVLSNKNEQTKRNGNQSLKMNLNLADQALVRKIKTPQEHDFPLLLQCFSRDRNSENFLPC